MKLPWKRGYPSCKKRTGPHSVMQGSHPRVRYGNRRRTKGKLVSEEVGSLGNPNPISCQYFIIIAWSGYLRLLYSPIFVIILTPLFCSKLIRMCGNMLLRLQTLPLTRLTPLSKTSTMTSTTMSPVSMFVEEMLTLMVSAIHAKGQV